MAEETHQSHTFHIAMNSAKYRPVMTNTFRVKIYDLGEVKDITGDDPESIYAEDDFATVLEVSNETFQEPNLSQGTVAIKRGNLVIEFPGAMEAFSSSSTFTCFIDADTYGKLYAWKCQSGNHETGEVGNPEDYWKTVVIEHLTGKGDLIGTWTLNNCWISQLQGVTFSNNSAEIKTVNVTFRYFNPQWRKAGEE